MLYETKRTERIFTMAIMLSMIGNVYAIKKINMGYGEVLIILAIIICVIRNGMKYSIRINNENNGFGFYFAYSFIVTIMIVCISPSIGISNAIMRLIRDTFYIAVLFFFSSSYFNREYAIKLVKIFSLILALFVIFQFVLYFFTHIYVSGLLDWPSLSSGDKQSLVNHNLATAAILGYLRPNGFLIEPASCAHILSIGVLLLLFSEDEKKKLLKIAILCVGMVMTTSLNAIVLLIAAFAVYYVLNIKRNGWRLPIKMVALLIIVVVAGAIAYFTVPTVRSTINRFTYLKTNTTGSTAVRLLRGIAFYKEMPLMNKVFGIGFGNFIGFKNYWNISTVYEMDVEYFNTASYVLISSGIIGFLILGYVLIRLFKRIDWISKGVLILIIITSLSSSVYSTPYMLIAMSIVLHGRKKIIVETNLAGN